MFKFYLDNNLVSDPINWSDFSETIERDDTIKGLLPKYEIKLQFNAGGYDYLMKELVSGGFCRLVELRVDSVDFNGNAIKTELNGYIFLTECKFNLNKKFVDCEVEDSNYGARIYRNKTIKTYLDTDKTKNGENLVLCEYYDTQFFTPSSGTYSGTSRKLFKLKDAFRFLVEFMTDNLVGFESNYLDNFTIDLEGSSIVGNMGLITGEGIRNPGAGLSPFVSFEDLFKEFNKKYPIAFTIITGIDGRPTLKIEEDAYFFNANDSIQIEDIEDLRQSFDNEVLYSSVKFGSPTVEFNPSLHHFGYIRFLSFKEEQYYLQGNCNIDKTLDLYGEYICDSNIIEELFVTNTLNTSYDKDIFFIQTNGEATSPTQAVKYENPTTGSGPYYYNGNLTNDKISARYNYNGSLALYLSGAIIGFRATKTIQQPYGAYSFPSGGTACSGNPDTRYSTSSGVYVLFEDDSTPPNFDIAGNYSTALNRYTASVAGQYVFDAAVFYSVSALGGFNFNMYYKTFVEFRRFNSSNVLMQSSQTENPINPSGFSSSMGTQTTTHTASFTLDVGDYVVVAFWFYYCPINCTVNSSIIIKLESGGTSGGTWFRTIASPTSGGVYQDANVSPYFTSKFEFQQPLAKNKYDTLKLDLSKSVGFNYEPLANKKGWLRKVTRKYSTGETTWELISNITNSN